MKLLGILILGFLLLNFLSQSADLSLNLWRSMVMNHMMVGMPMTHLDYFKRNDILFNTALYI
jgi:hypothetical protein